MTWLLTSFFLITLEFLMPTFVFLAIAISCLSAQVIKWFQFPLVVQWGVFMVVLVCIFFIILPLFKHFLLIPEKK